MLKRPIIAPSLLSADFLNLGQEVENLNNSGVDWLHFDVMDGHFVPNITYGPIVVSALKPILGNMLADVHLMIDNVDQYIPHFANAGADMISVHVENNYHLHRSIQLIKSFGIKAGIALNPVTPLEFAYQAAEFADFILLMSVNPGFGGQAFIDSFCRRSYQLKNHFIKNGLEDIEIEVDGGIKANNIGLVVENGASIIVSGSGVFNGNIKNNIYVLRKNSESVIFKI